MTLLHYRCLMCFFNLFCLEEQINHVVLNEEVLPEQPVLFAGSDDTNIYAVDMVQGKLKWKIKTKKDTG